MRNRQVRRDGGGDKASSSSSTMGILLKKLKLNNQELVIMLFNNIKVISLNVSLERIECGYLRRGGNGTEGIWSGKFSFYITIVQQYLSLKHRHIILIKIKTYI